MTLSTFPTFLTFLTQAPCFPAPASDPGQGPEIPPYLRRECLGPQTVEPEANDLTGRLESASTASTLRPALMRNSDRSASGSLAHARALLAEGP
jgi:hypothetical protein